MVWKPYKSMAEAETLYINPINHGGITSEMSSSFRTWFKVNSQGFSVHMSFSVRHGEGVETRRGTVAANSTPCLMVRCDKQKKPTGCAV